MEDSNSESNNQSESAPIADEASTEVQACGAEASSETSVEDGEKAPEQAVAVPAAPLEPEKQQALIEALLFVHGEPISLERLHEVSKIEPAVIETILAQLKEKYQDSTSGVELAFVANQYQLRTKGCFSENLRALRQGAPRRLSAAALETISIVAYRQPIVKSDIEKIRGVDATPTLKTLLERSLIKIVGHQPSVGQPALYGTTEEFLKLFGLSSLSELPTLRELKELEADPGETEDSDESSDSQNESSPVEAEQAV